MANHVLGELEVKIGERTFVLRPTFEGLAETETRASCSLAGLVNKIVKGEQGIRDVVAIVYGGIIGAAEKNAPVPSFDELGQLILGHGYVKLSGACGKFVGAAYSGRPIEEIAEPKSAKKKMVQEPDESEPKS